MAAGPADGRNGPTADMARTQSLRGGQGLRMAPVRVSKQLPALKAASFLLRLGNALSLIASSMF